MKLKQLIREEVRKVLREADMPSGAKGDFVEVFKNKLYKIDTPNHDAPKIIYQWIKQGHLSLNEFRHFLDYWNDIHSDF